jgi:sialate O-acetylesterase
MMTGRNSLSLLFVVVLLPGLVRAEVKLPSIISDHMVLLKAEKVPIWGKADAGEEVAVTLNGQTVKTTADTAGKWRVDLNLVDSPPGPFEMTVQGKNAITIKDVLVGEVWLVAGQSNAGFEMDKILDSKKEVATAEDPLLREYKVIETPSLTSDQDDCPGFWRVVTPGSTRSFSALGYFLAKSLRQELNGPVAFINNSWGGVSLWTYLSSKAIAAMPEMAGQALEQKEASQAGVATVQKWLKETGREDRETEDITSYTEGPFTAEKGWEKAKWVDRSNLLVDGREPEHGVFWIGTEVTTSPDKWPSPKRLLVCNNGLFEKVYWNGHLIGETSYENRLGKGTRWHYYIPRELVKEGANYLAIRFYAPIDFPGFGWWPGLEGRRLDWRIKKEFGLPPLPDGESAPKLAQQGLGGGSLFNGMLEPIMPYAIRGAVWYQGESDVKGAFAYREKLPLLIKDWREHWGQGDFPFYICQLANFKAKTDRPVESTLAVLREAQKMALSLPQTGLAVLIDAGEAEDIHPLAKDVAGDRVARIALAKVYGRDIPYSGPLYESMSVEGDKIRLRFKYSEDGLGAKELPAEYDIKRTAKKTAPLVRNSPNSELEGFAICGEDKKWVWADAKIDGDTVLVWSDKVPAPVAVRYAWADNPTCNLYNHSGLPASPFRTDDFAVTNQK